MARPDLNTMSNEPAKARALTPKDSVRDGAKASIPIRRRSAQRAFAGLLFFALTAALFAQQPGSSSSQADLRFVVYFSRHGVRSPTGKAAAYNTYSSAPWPAWPVPPGYLTPHGYHLMELFGTYDRLELSRDGLLSASGCEDSRNVSIYADSDQRTQETGKALAAGLFPRCPPPVHFFPEGTIDPLFHRTAEQMAAAAPIAVASIAGRIGGSTGAVTEAYRGTIEELDHILSTCGNPAPAAAARTSLFSVPATVQPGEGDHLAEIKGPLYTASTLSENLLLAYTEGKPTSEVGWGCVDGTGIRRLIGLHTAATEYTQRSPVIAAAQASNLLDHIRRALAQAATQKAVPGSPSRVSDRALFLVGHDTNILNMAALLHLNWIADGRRDDTAPGGALAFELWQDRRSKAFTVRVFYTVQTLEQMRDGTPLTLQSPPQRVALFIPGCSQADLACTWKAFDDLLRQAADPRFIDRN
jgi:4-phytase / acid phosphatase